MNPTSAETLVIIGFAEALSAPEVVWSLVDSGYRVLAFSRRGRRGALRHSCHVSLHDITAPEKDYKAALAELSSLVQCTSQTHRGNTVLLPIDDTSVWLSGQISAPSNLVFAGPGRHCTKIALDKQEQIKAAVAAGFNVPCTSVVSSVEELSRDVSRFPVILRPANAVSVHETRLRKGRNWICSNESELTRARLGWNGADPMLVQPFLEGSGEGVFGLATEDGVVAWSAHRRLRMMNPHGSGSSACASKTVPDDLKNPVSKFIRSSGWRGMFMIELLRTTDGKIWFVEFNGRAWGSMALARRQLLEYPAWTVKLALDPQATPNVDCMIASEEFVCRSLGREVLHLLFLLRGPQSHAMRWPSFWHALTDMFRSHPKSSFYNWRKDDWRVFVTNCWYTVLEQVFKPN